MKPNFCQKCGSKTNRIRKNIFECISCQRKEFINPKPTNAIIIESEKGEILFAKRKDNPGKGLWDLPGGFMNPGETIEESMKRELKEETGGTLKKFEYFGSYSGNYLYQGEDLPIIVACFIGKLKNSNLKANDDVEELFFISKSKLLSKKFAFNKIAFHPLRDFIKDYLKIKR
jgi:NAD+ diphosphatase